MDSWYKYGLLFGAVFAPLAIAADANAQSGSGLVVLCQISYRPPASSPTFGSAGYLSVSYEAGSCAGPPATSFFCTSSATNASCDPSYLYTEGTLMALYNQLVSSKNGSKQVNVFTTGAGKGAYVQF